MKLKISYSGAAFAAILLLTVPCWAFHKSPDSHVNGWKLAGMDPRSYESGIDRNVKYSGSVSAFIASKTQDSTKWTTLMQTIKADKYKGKRIRLSAWIKTENLNNWVGLWMRVDKGALSPAFDNMNKRRIKGTTDWKQYYVVLDVDSTSDDIAFGLLIEGGGKAWVDDIKIESVDNKSVPVTSINYAKHESSSNLSFEKISPQNMPENWWNAPSYDGYKTTSDHSTFHDGSASVRLESIDGQKSKSGFGTVTGRLLPDSFAGKRVLMTGWIKTENVKKWAGLWMRVDGEKIGEMLGFDNMEKRRIKGTTDWTKYEIVLDVPKQATYIYFGALCVGSGKLWLDEIKFEPVGNDVASTNIYTTNDMEKLQKYTAKKMKSNVMQNPEDIHDSPVNLDFEG